MKPRNTVLAISWVTLVIFISLLQIWAIYDPIAQNEKKDFIDTENQKLPEIIVNEEKIEEMPKAEKTVTKKQAEDENTKNISQEIPESINLKVPFYSQAPDGNWSLPWKEACEESSVVLAYSFLQDKELTKQTFKSEVLEIVELQKELLGKFIDTSMAETAQFLEEYYDYTDYQIIDNPGLEDIKSHLSQGHPIIAPFAGKKLWNSFFTNGGPRYHVLVITWYDDKEDVFYTNDVWTSRGEHFAYEQSVIMDALHDLVPNGQWDITDWEKRILVMK